MVARTPSPFLDSATVSAVWFLPSDLTSLCLNVFIYDTPVPSQGHREG